MTTLLGMMLSFAATGEVGPFGLGMPAEEADRLLGGGTGLAGRGACGYRDGSLELWSGADGVVRLLGFDQVDGEGRFESPSGVGVGAPREAVEGLGRETVIDGLEQLGCGWRRYDALTFDDQFAIMTEAGVSAVFGRGSRAAAGEWVLASLYASGEG